MKIRSTKYFFQFAVLGCIVLLGSGCVVTDKASSLWDKAKSLVGIVDDVDVNPLTAGDQHTVIVPGYGAPVAGNDGYEGYIQKVADFVNDEVNGVDAVVFSGGYTILENTSEAESMNSYFNGIVDTEALRARGVRVYKEECAILSLQNITYSEELLTKEGIAPDVVTVFGDVNREDKLKAYASVVFNKDFDVPDTAQGLITEGVNYTDVAFRGYDFGDSVQSEEKRNAIFAAEIVGAYDTVIGNEIIKQRINDWTKEFGYDIADNLFVKGCTQYEGFR